MNIEDFRAYCLSFPEVEEKMPFEKFCRGKHSILVFYVNKKMFCFFKIDMFDRCTIKCLPEQIDELKERYRAVGHPYNGSPKHWISVRFNEDLPDDKLKSLVWQSYEIVRSSKPR